MNPQSSPRKLSDPVVNEHGKSKVGRRECFKIVVKTAGPLCLTAIIGAVLILSLTTSCRFLGIIPCDAMEWPAFSGSATNANQHTGGSSGKVTASPGTATSQTILDVEALHCVLALTTCLLIFLNTWLYVVENDDNPVGERTPSLQNARRIVAGCEAVTIIWMIKLIFGWNWGSLADEILALGIFSVFLCVDMLNRKIFRAKEATDPSDLALRIEATFASGQAAFVDLPVVVGMMITIILAVYVDWKFSGSRHYLAGFFSGATVMHLAASQMIFAVLAFNRKYSLTKLGPLKKR